MRLCKDWIYRCIYGCHYLMSTKNNTIICISPIIGKLFEILENTLTFDIALNEWYLALENQNIAIKKEDVVLLLRNKGVIYDE